MNDADNADVKIPNDERLWVDWNCCSAAMLQKDVMIPCYKRIHQKCNETNSPALDDQVDEILISPLV